MEIINNFVVDQATFYVAGFDPDKKFIKRVTGVFKDYDLFPERLDFNSNDILEENESILDTLSNMGVFKIEIKTMDSIHTILDKQPKVKEKNLLVINYLGTLKNNNPKIGIIFDIVGETLTNLDWLPKNMQTFVSRNNEAITYSYNIYIIEKIVYFAIFKLVDNFWSLQNYVEIGEEELFQKNSLQYMPKTKRHQIIGSHEYINEVYSEWLKLYQTRRQECSKEMIYENSLDDMIIYLYNLYEFTKKFQVQAEKHILVWTYNYNEFGLIQEDGSTDLQCLEFAEKYSAKTKKMITDAYKNFEADEIYAFINDFYGKELINI